MKKPQFSTTIILSGVLAFALTGLIFLPVAPETSSNDAARTAAFNLEHSTIGSSDLTLSEGAMVVTPTNRLSMSGVRVHAGDASAINLEFDPIGLDRGGVLTATLIDQQATPLISVVHERLEKGTDIKLAVDGLAPLLKNPTIEVVTYKDDIQTASFEIPVARLSAIGTVNVEGDEDDEDWEKTYHYICDEFGCMMAVDPVNTYITFVDDPDTQVPFQYLGFRFELKDGIDESTLVESMELAGVLMDPITVNSADTIPLHFD